MAYYIKVTPQVCNKLGHGEDRNDTADKNKLLWQADLNEVEGKTIFEAAAAVGGAALTPQEAKEEIDGCDNPVHVYTPEAYKMEQNSVMSDNASEETAPEEVMSKEGGIS